MHVHLSRRLDVQVVVVVDLGAIYAAHATASQKSPGSSGAQEAFPLWNDAFVDHAWRWRAWHGERSISAPGAGPGGSLSFPSQEDTNQQQQARHTQSLSDPRPARTTVLQLLAHLTSPHLTLRVFKESILCPAPAWIPYTTHVYGVDMLCWYQYSTSSGTVHLLSMADDNMTF